MTARSGAVGALLAAALLVGAAPVSAQRFAVELRAGAAVGNYTATQAGLDLLPAPAFGATVEARLTPSVAAYAGITRSSFGCEEGFCVNRDVVLTSQGAVLGVRWAPGLLWARAGLAVQSLSVASIAPDETSDLGIGWDLGAGVEVPVGRAFRIRPGITYLRHGAATSDGDGHVALLALELGVARRF